MNKPLVKLFLTAVLIILPINSFAFRATKKQIAAAANKLIVVEVKKRTLKFFVDGELVKQYIVCVGTSRTPTPIGKGYIGKKWPMVIFRYQVGSHKGEVIRWATLSNGKVIKMPYKKMKGLNFNIPGYDPDKYSIHSTTESETMGKAASLGCVRMRIPDMLEFYPLVDVGTRIIIKP